MKNRWLVVLGALIIQMSLGAVFIYSIFKTPLQQLLGWDKSQVAIPAQVVLFSFAFAMIFAGRVQDKVGPRIVASVGGIVLGLGLILAGLTQKLGGGLGWFVFTFSVMGGMGIGTAYVCPISACVKWFPDKRGLITGIAVAGFGAGGLVFAPIARALIERSDVLHAIMMLGVIFLAAILTGSQFLSNPPEGYCPEGWKPDPASSSCGSAARDYSCGEMLKTPQFYLLWLTYFAGCTAGLMIIMNVSTIWQSFSAAGSAAAGFMESSDFDVIKAAGAVVVSVIAAFNAVGRIAWGKISDLLGNRTKTLIPISIVCALTMFSLDRLTTYPMFLAGAGLIASCFGGYLALYPAVVADFYGTKNIGANYGLMYTAYGAGGLLGPWLQAGLVEKSATLNLMTGGVLTATFDIINYRTAFMVSGAMCAAAVVLIFFTKPPSQGYGKI